MTNMRISNKARSLSPPAKVKSPSRHLKHAQRSTCASAAGRDTPADHGFSMSISMSPTAIRCAAWLLAIMVVLTVCWFAPDAAVLAAKVKAICEALKLLK
ncbi:MAG: hypothetical protein QOJ64_1678 [Acidobacteriota bacterium]|nr:hypothetical protein [Acidobacteriota bacterium]